MKRESRTVPNRHSRAILEEPALPWSSDAQQSQLRPLTVRVRVAAAMLGIGRSKLYELIAEGEVETLKIGNATLIPVDCLHQLIEKRRFGSQS